MDNTLRSDHPSFTQIPDNVIYGCNLNPYAGWLYVIIMSYTRKDNPTAFPSLATLEKQSGMSKRAVIDYLRILQEKGLIDIKPRNKDDGRNTSNLYIMRDPTKIDPENKVMTIKEAKDRLKVIGSEPGSPPLAVSQDHPASEPGSPEEEPLKQNQFKKTTTALLRAMVIEMFIRDVIAKNVQPVEPNSQNVIFDQIGRKIFKLESVPPAMGGRVGMLASLAENIYRDYFEVDPMTERDKLIVCDIIQDFAGHWTHIKKLSIPTGKDKFTQHFSAYMQERDDLYTPLRIRPRDTELPEPETPEKGRFSSEDIQKIIAWVASKGKSNVAS